MVCHTPPEHKEIGVIPGFWWSRVKLSIGFLTFFLTITCVLGVQMGHACSFQTFTFQELSNDTRNVSI